MNTPASAPSTGNSAGFETEVGLTFLRFFAASPHYIVVDKYRRHLPHLYSLDCALFVTWRLHGTMPPGRNFPREEVKTSGAVFDTLDRILDQAHFGPSHLRNNEIAAIVRDAIVYNSAELLHYELHAYAIIPNHVHILLLRRSPCQV